MSLRRFAPLLLIGFLVLTSSGGVLAQGDGPSDPEAPDALAGPGFTYQGQLRSSGSPVTATCDFQFGLWNALAAGAQVGNTQMVPNVSVAQGLFTVILNGSGQFGGRAFDGGARWLAIAVRCPA